MKMMREKKSPGLKILWAWTLGTAAILVANVVRTRVKEMDQIVTADHTSAPPMTDEGIVAEEKL